MTEITQTTDIDPATAQATNRKWFSAIDLQSKLKTSLFNKDLYFFYLGSFGGAATKFSAAPTLNDDAYLFVQYHEFDVYYKLLKNFILTGYLGLEGARGGQFTAWDLDSQLPLKQFGSGFGVGFDWMIAENTGLYLRYRWLRFEDESYSLDKFKGREVTLELKTFF